MKTGLESLDTGASDITYSGNEGPKSPQQIAEADYMLLEEYQKYVFEMEEMGQEPMSLEQFRQEAMSGMAMGGRAGYKDGYSVQGGVKNYEPSEMVTVPKIAKSSPDTPTAKLAYITPEEQDILIDLNLYGSLDGKPNRGPGGIPSLEGDFGTPGGYVGGGGGRQDNDVSGRRDTGTGNYQKSERQADVEARKEYEKNRAIREYNQKQVEKLKNIKPSNTQTDFKFPSIVNTGIEFFKKLKNINNIKQRQNFLKQLKVGPGGLGDIDYDEDYLLSDEGLTELNALGYQDYLNRFNTGGGGDGGGGQQQMAGIQSVAPVTTAATTPATTTTAATTPVSSFAQTDEFPFKDYFVGDSPSTAQLAYGKAMGVDPRMYGLTAYAADGGRIGYAGGGITDLRQGYFLGKLVKKVTRGIKKVVKSPLGKAALLGMAGFGIPGTQFGGLLGKGALTGLKGKLLGVPGADEFGGSMGLLRKLGLTKGGFGSLGGLTKRGVFGGITALSSLPLLMGTGDEEEGSMEGYRGEGMNIPGILDDVFSGKPLDPRDYRFMSRGSYDNGGIAGVRQAALKALPEYKTFNEDDEEEKFSLGGSAGLPPITQETQGMYSQSFSDDETPMPTQSDQMPMMNPMMARQNPMMSGKGMNPMMGRQMNPMMGGRMMAQEGGLMDMGGMEKDYRNEGGFVPIGGQERADDVPARLSKNEFVFTADAVRNAGGGDIDKGAEIMENMMENLEAGGEVSEESQGLDGARAMFATQKRLGEVL